MWYVIMAIGLLIAGINGWMAKKKGYFFWRTFFFTIILVIAVLAILSKLYT